MVILTPDAVAALKLAIEEFREYRAHPIVFFYFSDGNVLFESRHGGVMRCYALGQPHCSVFPAKSLGDLARFKFHDQAGLRVAVYPAEFGAFNWEIRLLNGRLVAESRHVYR